MLRRVGISWLSSRLELVEFKIARAEQDRRNAEERLRELWQKRRKLGDKLHRIV